MIRTNQGGSVASFIIVAALLVLGTAGLLYFVKRGDAPKVATPQVAVSDKKTQQKNTSNDAKKVDESENSTTKTQSTPNSTPNNSAANMQNTQAVNELSHTGPADDFIQVIMIGVLASIVVAYLQSRQQLAVSRSSL